MLHSRFPRLAPSPLRRTHVESWLSFHAEAPLRYLSGFCGSGKTAMANLYARAAEHPVAYVRVKTEDALADFLAAFAVALNVPPPLDESRLHDALEKAGRLEIIVDEVDRASRETRRLLDRLYQEAPENVTFTYLGRGRGVIDLVRAETNGAAAVAPPDLLAMTADEIAAYCDMLSVPYTTSDVNRLLYTTEGWTFAATAAIRQAASAERSLSGAYLAWVEGRESIIREVVTRSLADLEPADRQAAERMYAGELLDDPVVVERLRYAGLLVVASEEGLRPIRPVFAPLPQRSRARPEEERRNEDLPVATMELFGEFELCIERRRVEWQRRRDRQIIEFLALRPGGRATRAEVITAFWPESDPQMAAQSLRTACSTIRRAIAQCVGYDNVHHYFIARQELWLRTDNIASSAKRFQAHLEAAEEAFARRDIPVARAHYTSATRIYRAPLLDSEPPADWIAPHAAMYAELAAAVEQRERELRLPRGTFPERRGAVHPNIAAINAPSSA